MNETNEIKLDDLEKLVNELDPNETRDLVIKDFLQLLLTQSQGIQEKGINLLAKPKHLKNYTRKRINTLLKEIKENNDLNIFEDSSKKTAYEILIDIGDELMKEFDIISLKIKVMRDVLKDKIMMMIRNGISYSFDISPLVDALTYKLKSLKYGNYITSKKNVLQYIADSTLFDPSNFNTNPSNIPFENGIFNTETVEFTDIKDLELNAWHFFYHIPFQFKSDKDYDCPKFEQALKDWLSDPFIPNDIYEMLGYSFTMSMAFKKAFILLADTNYGKTQFINILIHLIPESVRSSTPLYRITKDQFGTDDLIFKIANICDDLPDNEILHSGLFKNLVGGTLSFQAEIKGGNKVPFTPYAKHWYATNKPSQIADPSDEPFFGRFIIIPFKNSFDLNNKNTIKDFYKTIINDPDEIQGILYKSMISLIDLLIRGHFREEIQLNTRYIWLYNSDPVYRFIDDFCEDNEPKERIDWKELKPKFDEEMLLGYSSQELLKRLSKHGHIKIESNGVYYITGLKWKPEVQKEINKEKETSSKINLKRIFVSEENHQIDEFSEKGILKDEKDYSNEEAIK